MKRRTFFLSLLGGAALGWTGWKSASSRPSRLTNLHPGPVAKVSRTKQALGTRISITAFHQDPSFAEEAIERAFDEVELVEQLMSLYRPDSQLSQLNKKGVLQNPHPYLIEVLQTASHLSNKTQGTFDITIQPLYQLYAHSAHQGTFPDPNQVAKTLAQVDWRNLVISSRQVTLHGDGTAITLNGIAQGFASDVLVKSLKRSGIENALIDSGEIGTLGRHIEDRAWSIGIKHPRNPDEILGLAELQGRCLATSGDYETRFDDGYEHHHLFDPNSGLSSNEFSSVSIVAPTALQADALSTAVFVMGIRKGRALVEATPNVDALFVAKNGQVTRTTHFPLIT